MKPNKASSTARLIARSMICLCYEKSDLAFERYVNILEACSNHFGKFNDPILFFLKNNLCRKIIKFILNLIIPGLIYHYAIRKREIRRICNICIRENKIEQVIIIGAGFDTLSFELRDSYPSIQIIEYDHSSTQNIRIMAIESLMISMHRINLYPIDLNSSLDILKEVNRSKKTLVIAEGLLMYLSDFEVRKFIHNLQNFIEDNFNFIFTFIDSSQSGNPNFYKESPIVDMYLRWKNEPFRWGIKSNSIKGFLKETNMKMEELVVPSEFMKEYYSFYSAENEIQERIVHAISVK